MSADAPPRRPSGRLDRLTGLFRRETPAPVPDAAVRPPLGEFLDGVPGPEDVVAAHRWILGRDPKATGDLATLRAASRRELRRAILATKASLHEHLKNRFGDEKWVMAEVLDGKRIWLNLADRHVSMGGLVGTWEEPETRFMRDTLRPGQVVVDVGANIGWFSLVASECVGPTGRVHAFEPQARVFRYLARTVAENDLLGRVLPYEMALSDRWGTADLAWNPDSANMGHAWLGQDAPAGGSLGSVRTGVLDDLMGGAPVHFLKIDAEGAEALVLSGAREILKTQRPVVMLEILPKFLERVSGAAPQAILDLFAQAGYRGREIGPAGLGDTVDAWPEGRVEMNCAFLPG